MPSTPGSGEPTPGIAGAPGIQGAPGIAGAPGTAGASGTAEASGIHGAPGIAGALGIEGAPGAPPPLRASDADRHATVHRLQDALARGLLTFDEAGERMSAAYAARFARDLPPLTADLPRPAPAPVAPPGWQRVWQLLLEQLRAEIALVSAGGLRSPRARRTVVVGVFLLVMLATFGALALHGLSGGEPPPFRGGFGPGGFGHR